MDFAAQTSQTKTLGHRSCGRGRVKASFDFNILIFVFGDGQSRCQIVGFYGSILDVRCQISGLVWLFLGLVVLHRFLSESTQYIFQVNFPVFCSPPAT